MMCGAQIGCTRFKSCSLIICASYLGSTCLVRLTNFLTFFCFPMVWSDAEYKAASTSQDLLGLPSIWYSVPSVKTRFAKRISCNRSRSICRPRNEGIEYFLFFKNCILTYFSECKKRKSEWLKISLLQFTQSLVQFMHLCLKQMASVTAAH